MNGFDEYDCQEVSDNRQCESDNEDYVQDACSFSYGI